MQSQSTKTVKTPCVLKPCDLLKCAIDQTEILHNQTLRGDKQLSDKQTQKMKPVTEERQRNEDDTVGALATALFSDAENCEIEDKLMEINTESGQCVGARRTTEATDDGCQNGSQNA